MQVRVEEWDGDLAVQIPDAVMQEAGFSVGQLVEVEILEGSIVVRQSQE